MKKLLINRGFTLVELLIVIAVIGILAASAVALLNPLEQIKKANDAKRKSDLNQIQKALDMYYNDKGRYPESVIVDMFSYKIKSESGVVLEWGDTGWQYINPLPKDPVYPKRSYGYYSPSDRQSYYLYASLERADSDPQACNEGLQCLNVPGFMTCGTDRVCNYGVTSPNTSP